MTAMVRKCSFDGCDKPLLAKSLCQGHYEQQRKGKYLRPLLPHVIGLPLEQRFWVKVDKNASKGCWDWTAARSSNGYGRIYFDGSSKASHRVSWEFANGPIPEGMVIDHICANRLCVNPEHMRDVTNTQNIQHRTVINKNNTSGVRGVYWAKHANAWAVYVMSGGKPYSGGLHPTLEAADAAAKALRAQLFTHDDHDEWLKQTQGDDQ